MVLITALLLCYIKHFIFLLKFAEIADNPTYGNFQAFAIFNNNNIINFYIFYSEKFF